MRNNFSRLCFTRLRNLFQITAWMLLIILPFILMYLFDPALLKSITQILGQHQMTFRLCRWGAILFFILLWPFFVRKFGERYGASEEQIIRWRSEIYRIALWIIIFEILVCENVINKLIHLL